MNNDNKRDLLDSLINGIISNKRCPANLRSGIEMGKAILETMERFAGFDRYMNGMEDDGEFTEKAVKIRQDVVDYLGLVNAGVQTFFDAHPIPEEMKRNDESD